MGSRRVLVVPDLHAPYQHPRAYAFIKSVARKVKPTDVVLVGDEIDAHSMSRFSSDPDLGSPGDELGRAIDALRPLYKLFPSAMVCASNHTQRPFKKAFAAGLPAGILRGVREVLQAPEGWRWADQWVLDNVLYIHGDGYGGRNAAANAAERLRQSVVMGHVHSNAGVHWMASRSDAIFGMGVGALVDQDAAVFAYAKYQARRPVLGCGVVEDGVPRFIPL